MGVLIEQQLMTDVRNSGCVFAWELQAGVSLLRKGVPQWDGNEIITCFQHGQGSTCNHNWNHAATANSYLVQSDFNAAVAHLSST
jgi:hypothetical protein